ncbi:MAG TPA: phospho-N-acetylmuramoyl-pentapeptide-transferase, partial [Acidimicrobiales bacterium]|nr:phospho-N-acetylmuramoyl-pentapeptide-transferase [Acidimicrobiales bacterium]
MVSLLLSGGVALLIALIGTPVLIASLKARGIGQQIREDGPRGHITKAGTPTMGGLVIVTAAVVGYAAGHLRAASRGHVRVTAVFTTPGLTVIFTIL